MEVVCFYCEKKFSRKKSSVKRFNFCSRACKEKAQSLESGFKFDACRPTHYSRTGNSIWAYRRKALEFYGSRCTVCGYGVVECLEVHHKDSDRSNNDLSNLDVLCPTHHKEFQLGIRRY